MNKDAAGKQRQRSLRPEGSDDAELLVAAREGSQAAFAELWRRHYELALSITRTLAPADADDIVAEAFTSTWDKIQRGIGPSEHFRAYLISTCRNMAARTYRDRQRTVTVAEIDDDQMDGSGQPARGAAEIITRGETHQSVTHAFSLLPERWQKILWWQEVEDVSRTEIAQRLDLSPNSVSALTRRAKEGLRIEWLRLQLPRKDEGEHDEVLEQLPKYLRGSLPRKRHLELRNHLKLCRRCAELEHGLRNENRVLGQQLVMKGALAAFIFAGVTGVTSAGLGQGIGAAAAAGAAASPASLIQVGQRGIRVALERGHELAIGAKMATAPVVATAAVTAAAATAAVVGVTLVVPTPPIESSAVDTPTPTRGDSAKTPSPSAKEAPDTTKQASGSTAATTDAPATTKPDDGAGAEVPPGTGEVAAPPPTTPTPPPPTPTDPPPPVDPPATNQPLTAGVVSARPPQVAGTASAGAVVRVAYGNQSMLILVDGQGNWFADLAPLGLAPGVHSLTVSQNIGEQFIDSLTITVEVTP